MDVDDDDDEDDVEDDVVDVDDDDEDDVVDVDDADLCAADLWVVVLPEVWHVLHRAGVGQSPASSVRWSW